MKSPTFLLKPSAYDAGTLYSVLPENGDGDFTVSSAANGTRIDRSGKMVSCASTEPRIDYLNSVPKLLLEPSRTNYATTVLNASSFVAIGSTKTEADAYAPDGFYSAARVEDQTTTGASPGMIQDSYTINDDTKKQSYSFFVKFTSCESITVQINGGENVRVEVFDDGSHEIDAANTSSGITVSVIRYPNGWFRVETGIQPTAGVTTSILVQIWVGSYNDVSNSGYFHIWGFQLEEGDFCTSLIRVSGSTRAADTMNVGSLITNNIINRSLGSLFLDVHVCNNGLADSTGNMVILGTTSGLLSLMSTSNGTPSYARVTGASTTTEQQVSEGRKKILFNMDGDTVETWINGTLAATDSNGDVGLTSEVFTLNGAYNILKVYEIAMWDTPLDATESKSMTQ